MQLDRTALRGVSACLSPGGRPSSCSVALGGGVAAGGGRGWCYQGQAPIRVPGPSDGTDPWSLSASDKLSGLAGGAGRGVHFAISRHFAIHLAQPHDW